MNTQRQITIDDLIVVLETGRKDGEPFLSLRGINCDLEGEEPGVYYLKHRHADRPPTVEEADASDLAKWTPERMESIDDVRPFLGDVVAVLGRGFHPDTPFASYVHSRSGGPVDGAVREDMERTFTDEEATRLDECMALAFTLTEDSPVDVYEMALAEMNPQADGAVAVPGDRIRLRRNVERFPHFIAKAGSLGEITEAHGDGSVWAKMDVLIPGCEEWDNEIAWTDVDAADFALDAERLPSRGFVCRECGRTATNREECAGFGDTLHAKRAMIPVKRQEAEVR